MKLQTTMIALALAAPLSFASAQACIGSIAAPPPQTNNYTVSGLVDFVEDNTVTGARLSFTRNSQKSGTTTVHAGLRSFSAGGTSVKSLDLQMASGLRQQAANDRLCVVAGIDIFNFDDSDFSTNNVYLGFGIGTETMASTTVLVPYGSAGLNIFSPPSSIGGDQVYSAYYDLGVGARLGDRLTATLSVRGTTQENSQNVMRIVVAYPFGPR